MRSFNRFGSNDDPWFRIGTFDVNTTALVTGLGLLSMFIWAAEGEGGTIFGSLQLITTKVTGGQLWRLVTWPIPNVPDIWTVILLAVFFMLGSQLEAAMGRRLYTILLAAMTIIPATLFVLITWASNSVAGIGGLRMLELGVLCAFAAKWPNAQFFFGIPAWVIAGVIVVIDALQVVGGRSPQGIVLLIAVVAVALLGIRSMGFAEEAEFIPKLPLPASLGGEYRPPAAKKPRRSARSTHLSAVPDPANEAMDDAEINALLDQVSNEGLDSLTSAQRKRLEQHSKRLRKRRDS